MLVHRGGGGADAMSAMINALHSEPAGLIFVYIGFEVAAAHRLFFWEMMSGTNNLLWLDNKIVEKLVTVARTPVRGVAGVLVKELAKWNFRLLVYYAKLCDLRIRPVILADTNDNSLRSIK